MAKAVSPTRRAAARSALSKTKNSTSRKSPLRNKKKVVPLKKLAPLPSPLTKKAAMSKKSGTSPRTRLPAKTSKPISSRGRKSKRVSAKKVVIKSANSSTTSETEIEDEISIESEKKDKKKKAEDVKSPKLRVKKSTLINSKKKKRSIKKRSESSPKKESSSATSASANSSPTRRNRTRAVKPFNGAQRLASVAKKIFSAPENERPQAIVVEKAVFDSSKERRKRQPWTDDEVNNLTRGVEKHGEGSWAAILNDPSLKFRSQRNQVDLKDKWRNLNAYVSYAGHPIRRFMLVDSTHQPILSNAGNQHIFRNRWPRDAALKVATRDEFYPTDPDNPNGLLKKSSVIVHLKEIIDDPIKSETRPQIVHVYRATRILSRPRAIPKFSGYAAVWTGKVEKIAEEILIRSSEIMNVDHDFDRDHDE